MRACDAYAFPHHAFGPLRIALLTMHGSVPPRKKRWALHRIARSVAIVAAAVVAAEAATIAVAAAAAAAVAATTTVAVAAAATWRRVLAAATIIAPIIVVVSAAIIVATHLLVDKILHPALGEVARRLEVAKDEKLLRLPAATLDKAEGAGVLLDLPKGRATVARHVADGLTRHGHDRYVVPILEVLDVHRACALLEEPLEVGASARALLDGPTDERHLADILHDAPRGARQLAPSGAILAERVRELRLIHRVRVGRETLLLRDELLNLLGEVLRTLGLYGRHAFELSAAAATAVTEDGELLGAVKVAPAIRLPAVVAAHVGRHKEHERAPFLLDFAQGRAPGAGDVPDAVARHVDHRAVFAFLPALDVHRPAQLLEEPVEVLLRPLALVGHAGHEDRVADIFHNATRRARELLARHAFLPKGVRELIRLEYERLGAKTIRRIVIRRDLACKVPDALGFDGRHHLELCAAASALVAKDGKLLNVALLALASAAEVSEEHQRPPLLLDLPQEIALRAGDEADSLRGHHDDCQIVVIGALLNGDRADTLRHHAFDVLLRALALVVGSTDLERQGVLEQIELCAGNTCNLLLCLAILAKDKGSILVGNLQHVNLWHDERLP
mmetsp:Transcript_35988/g.94683  ORF Transcript_35988/g.94683 Transcript_35988/m.94683 type:complete len:618 (-) Transcript_35988:11-1864(-)